MMNAAQIDELTGFFLHLDELKAVERRTYLHGGTRRENSAEHSWHLAMACWAFAELLPASYDVGKLIKMALVHDLGEIGAGDTFLYAENRDDAHIAERESVADTAARAGNPIDDLLPLWEEQETGSSPETRLLKVIDRLLPFLHNINSEGRAWRDNGVSSQQVLQRHGFIRDELPELHAWVVSRVEDAVERGWLAP